MSIAFATRSASPTDVPPNLITSIDSTSAAAARMQNAKCKMQKVRTAVSAFCILHFAFQRPYRTVFALRGSVPPNLITSIDSTSAAAARMQNAKCKMQKARTAVSAFCILHFCISTPLQNSLRAQGFGAAEFDYEH